MDSDTEEEENGCQSPRHEESRSGASQTADGDDESRISDQEDLDQETTSVSEHEPGLASENCSGINGCLEDSARNDAVTNDTVNSNDEDDTDAYPSHDSSENNSSLTFWANSPASTVREPDLNNSSHLSAFDLGDQENQNVMNSNQMNSSSGHPVICNNPRPEEGQGLQLTEERSVNSNARSSIPASEHSEQHPLVGPFLDPLVPVIEDTPNVIVLGNFEQLRQTLDDEASSRNDFPLRNQWSGIMLNDQIIVRPYDGNFDIGRHFTPWDGSRLGQNGRVFICDNRERNASFITKQFYRNQFNRCEIELAIVSGSDVIIQPIGVIWNQDKIFTLQKHFTGISLTELLKTRHRLTDEEVHWLNYKMLHFLKSIHCLEILHRNIDSDHIIISRNDLKIYVVGCSSLCKRMDCMSITPCKSLFSAPEVIAGKDHSSACDMFSLGCTLHRSLSGKYPYFDCGREQRTVENMIFDIGRGEYPLNRYLAGFEEPWVDMISRMTHPNPCLRDSADKVLRVNYQREPPWQNWFFEPRDIDLHPRRTIYPQSPNRLDTIVTPCRTTYPPQSTNSLDTIVAPRLDLPSDLQELVGNIPSDEILDVEEESENGESSEMEPVMPPTKPVSAHSVDSGMDTATARELGLPPGESTDVYRIYVMENEQISTEVELPRAAMGKDLFFAVVRKLRLTCGCVFRYQGDIIGFDKRLHSVFQQTEVRVKMERKPREPLPASSTSETTQTGDEAHSFHECPNEGNSYDDMGSLTTQIADEEFPLVRSVLRGVGVAEFVDDEEQESLTTEEFSGQADLSEAQKEENEDQLSGSDTTGSTLTESRGEPEEVEREEQYQKEDCGMTSPPSQLLDRDESILHGHLFDAQNRNFDEESSDPEGEESQQADSGEAQIKDKNETIEWEMDEESPGSSEEVNERSEEVEAASVAGGSESEDSDKETEAEDVAADTDEEIKDEGDDSGCVDPQSEQTPESSFSDANNLTDDAYSPLDTDKGYIGEDRSPCS